MKDLSGTEGGSAQGEIRLQYFEAVGSLFSLCLNNMELKSYSFWKNGPSIHEKNFEIHWS